MNQLFLGDCLFVLRENIKSESVDLIYIDPPFNSKRDYNIFFDDKEITTQRVAFEDTWTFKTISDSLIELNTIETERIYKLLMTYQDVARHAFPYLVMMSLRLFELHRVLKPTGSFYLHCDPTMSHYLKTICDVIFGPRNYRNEISWKRSNPKSHNSSNIPSCRDVILRYTKTDNFKFNKIFLPLSEDYIEKAYKYCDNKGRKYRLLPLLNPNDNRPNLTYEFLGVKRVWRWTKDRMEKAYKDGLVVQLKEGAVPQYKKYLDDSEGRTITNDWNDIEQASGREALGYPTQKPKELLERIIQVSSDENDVVLDAFCGCGTTVDAAENLHRNWIGIDISPIAISLIQWRLNDTYGTGLKKPTVSGIPKDVPSAKKLWQENPYAFQDWWISEFHVFAGPKGADEGLDGIGQYLVSDKESIKVAFSVKGGKVKSGHIDELMGVLIKHKCKLGIFLTFNTPTNPMVQAAASAGVYKAPGNITYPIIQILTIKDFFSNKRPKLPSTNITFRQAKITGKKQKQIDIGF